MPFCDVKLSARPCLIGLTDPNAVEVYLQYLFNNRLYFDVNYTLFNANTLQDNNSLGTVLCKNGAYLSYQNNAAAKDGSVPPWIEFFNMTTSYHESRHIMDAIYLGRLWGRNLCAGRVNVMMTFDEKLSNGKENLFVQISECNAYARTFEMFQRYQKGTLTAEDLNLLGGRPVPWSALNAESQAKLSNVMAETYNENMSAYSCHQSMRIP